MEFEEIRRGIGPFKRCMMTHVQQATTKKHLDAYEKEQTASKVLDYLHREIHMGGNSKSDNRWMQEFRHGHYHGDLSRLVPIVVIVEVEHIKTNRYDDLEYAKEIMKNTKEITNDKQLLLLL